MLESTIQHTELLLLVAAIVAIVARRLRLPYTVGLVAAGVVIALSGISTGLVLTRTLIFYAFLPPLIFDAAINLPWSDLRRNLLITSVLATAGVAISAAVTAAGMYYVAGWTVGSSVLFGVLIAATDPVAVIAAFRESGATGRLPLIVEAESLFNDGTAAVAFALALAVSAGGSITFPGAVMKFIVVVGGSLVVGAVIAGAAGLLIGTTEEHLPEVAISVVAAFGSFLAAEWFHFSGVLSTLATGLIVGGSGFAPALTSRGKEALTDFWEFAAFVANSLIFLLIGAQIASFRSAGSIRLVIVAIGMAALGRAASVYPICGLFHRSRAAVPFRQQHVLFWGGLRGALALALALSIQTGARMNILTATFAVVAFSIVVQGLTIKPLLRGMGELKA